MGASPLTGITAGPKGSLWITAAEMPSTIPAEISRLTTSGIFTDYPILTNPTSPGGITPGPNSTLWFTDAAANAIGSFQSLVTNTHDFNGDGKSDIAWRDAEGNIAMWIMDGASIKSSTWMGSELTAWSLVGQRDFNGDGKSDWLWSDVEGNAAMWLLDGPKVKSSIWIGTSCPPPGPWSEPEISTATAWATFSGATTLATPGSGS